MDHEPSLMIVEDDPDDLLLIRTALARVCPAVPVRAKRDGIELMQAIATEEPPPALMLVDLNMPRMSGWELLGAIATVDGWSEIPLIILTTSTETRDRQRAAALGAKALIVKPDTFRELVAMLPPLIAPWFPAVGVQT
ncbi:response regulator [Flagellatimonas centrodinii]|uniref:response regulator n=1 Tax=Flagellatimonas centrodinii TaxID=2806210 RepID=UPI001FED438A|nr:response regulator [Flagellatimonas centrodinii]ULQ46328.1 response regulator [Flagellatimonas centrodinii]